MEDKKKKQIKIAGFVLLILIIAGIAYWYFSKPKTPPVTTTTTKTTGLAGLNLGSILGSLMGSGSNNNNAAPNADGTGAEGSGWINFNDVG